MDSGTHFELEKKLSKGAQATQSGGPPGFPMLPPEPIPKEIASHQIEFLII